MTDHDGRILMTTEQKRRSIAEGILLLVIGVLILLTFPGVEAKTLGGVLVFLGFFQFLFGFVARRTVTMTKSRTDQ